MKIINPNAHAVVILNWDEYRELLENVPEGVLHKILAGIGWREDLKKQPLTRDQLIRLIFTEYEEQAY